MSEDALRPCRIHLNMTTAEIIYVNGVLDSYEGLGIMRTADENQGKVIVYTTEHDKETVIKLFDSLKGEGLKFEITSIDNEDYVE